MEKLVPGSLSISQHKIEHISGSLTCYKVRFIVCPSRGLPKYIKTMVLTTFILFKAFLRNKKRSETSLPASFSP